MMEFALLYLSNVHYSARSLLGGLIVLFDTHRISGGGLDTGVSVLLIHGGDDSCVHSSTLFAGN